MKRGLKIYVWFTVAVLACPILIVLLLSFGDQGSLRFPPDSYSLRWFRALFTDSRWMASFFQSLKIATIASVVSTVAGFLFAYGLRVRNFVGRKQVFWLLLTPIMMPSVILAVALYYVSSDAGLIGNTYWLAICHSVVTLPISTMIILSSLKTIDQSIERAAVVLGASLWFRLTRVIIPLTLPGIVSSLIFSFLSSFDELIISLFLSDPRSQTLPVRIWNSLIFEVEPVITAVSAALIVLTALALGLETLARSRARSVRAQDHAA
jgi:ABC-type spermidine/putrescine transport system permease subunit II